MNRLKAYAVFSEMRFQRSLRFRKDRDMFGLVTARRDSDSDRRL